MSDDQTFERNARQWLEIGPSHVPTRIVDAALCTVATTPQQRTLRAPRRPQLLRNQRSLSFAAATAILALTLGGGYLFLRPIQSQVAVPVPTPTATPSSSSATQATPVPTPDSTPSSNIDVSSLGAAIQTKWLPLGDTRPSSGAEHGLMGAMIISDKNVQLEIYYASLNNSWSIDPSGTFQMTLESTATDLAHDRWQCATGDKGTYSLRLSADNKTLTFTALDDACAIRAAVMSGDWSRWPCPNPASRCDTELVPGLHHASFEVDPSVSFSPFLSGFSYSVPAGWSGVGPYLERRNDPYPMMVYVALDARALSRQPPCPDTFEPGVGVSAAALTTWLASLPDLATSQARPVTIDGYNGLEIDASVAPGFVNKCQHTGDWTTDGIDVDKFAFTLGVDGSGSKQLFISRDGEARYIVLNADNGDNILIGVSAPDQASFEDLVAAAMPVIESFHFTQESK